MTFLFVWLLLQLLALPFEGTAFKGVARLPWRNAGRVYLYVSIPKLIYAYVSLRDFGAHQGVIAICIAVQTLVAGWAFYKQGTWGWR